MKLIIFMFLFAVFANISYAYQESLGRVFTLETTRDPDRSVRLTAEGNTIFAEGFFKDYAVEDFFIHSSSLSSAENRFSRNADGSFTASSSGIITESSAIVVIRLENNMSLNYRVEYNDALGWFFGDNGLAARTAAALENYRVISPEISENYISAALCPHEIAETRGILLQIVAEVTAELTCGYQKAKALNRWVADNLVYDRDARDSEVTEETISIASTLRLRRSVCIGIANTYAALLEAAGIKALNIKGGIANPFEGVPYELLPTETLVHEWVAFWFEDENRWVYTDPTWDRQGFFENGNYHHRTSVIKHFDISGLALSFDHRGDTAELRQFFFADTVFDDSAGPLDEPGEPDEPVITTTPPPTVTLLQREELPLHPNEEFGLLYMTIGVLSLTAVIMVIIIIRIRRK
jgi:transglutaminase/protease-like cytokinesis protein 3